MQTNIQEIYQRTIRPLPEKERLKLAALIINDISEAPMDQKSGKKLSELFGSVSLGHATGADNESIDADLARAYLDPHEDEN